MEAKNFMNNFKIVKSDITQEWKILNCGVSQYVLPLEKL